jgi:uncharacterized protein
MTDDADGKLDDTIEATFPASDPPANTPETGVRVDLRDDAGRATVRDNRAAHRFELDVNGQVAVLVYERRADELVLVHTEVPPSLRGRGLADRLVREALEAARAEGRRVVPVCPFVRAYLRRHKAEPA